MSQLKQPAGLTAYYNFVSHDYLIAINFLLKSKSAVKLNINLKYSQQNKHIIVIISSFSNKQCNQ